MLLYQLKRHFHYTSNESRNVFITSLFIAFLFSFIIPERQFTIPLWIEHALILFVATAILMFLYTGVQKAIAIWFNNVAEYKSGLNILLVSTLLAFITGGYLVLPFAGRLESKKYSQGLGQRFVIETKAEMFATQFGGILLLFLLALLSFNVGGVFFDRITQVAASIAFVALWPIPGNPGLDMFFHNPYGYFTMLALGAVFWILLRFSNLLPFAIVLLFIMLVYWTWVSFGVARYG